MAAAIIDGKAAAARLRARVRTEADAYAAEHAARPGLKVVIVGDNPASRAYVRTKARMAEEAGIEGGLIELPDDVTQARLLDVVRGLNEDPAVHGILVQLPLPPHLNEASILDAIDPAKDVDGFHPLNVGRLFSAARGLPDDLLVPCTPYGCLQLLRDTLGDADLKGANAVVLGRSNIVGKPMAALLLLADCTVTVAHSKTKDLAHVCAAADVLVAAVGRPGMVEGAWVKEGAVVIDVGINRVPSDDGKGRLVGDVDFEAASKRAGAITPVPGGVGPMTVACLLRNTLVAARGLAGG